jgi:hypothetical protein
MLSKCANPKCSTPFHYLRDGKLFQIDVAGAGPQLVSEKRPAHKIEYFWLCGSCYGSMTLAFHRGKGVVTMTRPGLALRRAAAS